MGLEDDLDVPAVAKRYSLSEGEVKELIVAFSAIDSDGSGSIDADEIIAVLRYEFYIPPHSKTDNAQASIFKSTVSLDDKR